MSPRIVKSRLQLPAAFEAHRAAEAKLDEVHGRVQSDSFVGWVATRFDPTMPRRRVSLSLVPFVAGVAASLPAMHALREARAAVTASKTALFQALRADLDGLPTATPSDKQELDALVNDPELLGVVMCPRSLAEIETRSMLFGVAEALS